APRSKRPRAMSAKLSRPAPVPPARLFRIWTASSHLRRCTLSVTTPAYRISIERSMSFCSMAWSNNRWSSPWTICAAIHPCGESIRPEQGYPVRLVVPGWEGNVNVKWLHRLHVVDQPAMTRDETAHYTDLMPDGKAQIFTFVMEAKSVITRPAGGQKLAYGPG